MSQNRALMKCLYELRLSEYVLATLKHLLEQQGFGVSFFCPPSYDWLVLDDCTLYEYKQVMERVSHAMLSPQ